jgi:hypothetical protein
MSGSPFLMPKFMAQSGHGAAFAAGQANLSIHSE